MSALVRPVAPADLPAIQQIYAQHVLHGTATFELDPPPLAEMQARFDALVAGGHPALVAEQEGQVVGYGYAGPYRTRPAYRYTVEDSIYLHPAACGRGIGRQLLATLLAETSRRGFRQVIAVIGDSENHASIRLHRSAGFDPVGTFRHVGYKFGRWLDTVLMQRTLAEPSDKRP